MFIGFALLLSHDLHDISNRPFVVKGSTKRMYADNSLDATFDTSYINDNQQNITETALAEVRHIGFLKVHKAGSTTMQNMLFRFGLKRNLTFVIPKTGNQFGNSYTTLPVKEDGHYDIFAVHTNAFNKATFDKILPQDKVNIAIVREPLERMISAAYYYRNVWKVRYLMPVPKDNFIENLVDHPDKYEKLVFSHTKNAMGKDFGFKATTRESDIDEIQERLEFLDKEFRLVLVLERFDESLVLLKRYLGWQMSDIVHIPTNTHQHVIVNLTAKQKMKHKHTCFLDYAIYDFFSKLLDLKIKAEGPGFQDEVGYFRDVLQQLKAFCIQPGTDIYKLIVKESEWNSEFQVSKSECELMQIQEKTFIEQLRIRHEQMNS